MGGYVEIGTNDNDTSIANNSSVEGYSGKHILQARLIHNTDELAVFRRGGRIDSTGPDKRGSYQYKIYHPPAKVLFGISSGARWLGDKAYGGPEAAQKAANEVLTS